MIKEVLEQLEPLDAQIDALCSSTDDAEMPSRPPMRLNWQSLPRRKTCFCSAAPR